MHFASGLTTGVVSATILQPVDLLKTRLQQPDHGSLRGTLGALTSNGPSSILHLWRGTLPSVLRAGLGSALYFSSLDTVRRAVARSTSSQTQVSSTSALPRLSNTANLASGAIARTAAGFVLMPLTVLKIRYESDLYSYTSLRGAARGVFRTEGLRGFFAGAGATALRDAPNAGLYVLFYEQIKTHLSAQVTAVRSSAAAGVDGRSGAAFVLENGRPAGGSGQADEVAVRITAPLNFLSGILAGGAATALTNPFDAVKTRLQLRPKEYPNLWTAVRLMVGKEGFRSLFDGLSLRITRKALSSAIAWTLYEELVRFAGSKL